MKDIKSSGLIQALIKYYKNSQEVKDFCQNPDAKEDLGAWLKSARENAGLTIERVAYDVGTDSINIDSIEKWGQKVCYKEVKPNP